MKKGIRQLGLLLTGLLVVISLIACDIIIGPPVSKDTFTPNVMAPLEVQEGEWESFEAQLAVAKSMGITAVSVDVWWGKVETSDNSFDWSYYDKIFRTINSAGLKIVPIMSFHQCGGNVGDNVFIPIPSWIWSKYEGQTFNGTVVTADDMKYLSELGNLDGEVISIWYDDLVSNEYVDFMNAFECHYGLYANEFVEINISAGPSGELRYPSYQLDNGQGNDAWSYPHRGYLQSYSPLAVKSFQEEMEEKYGTIQSLNGAWGVSYSSFIEVQAPTNTNQLFGNSTYYLDTYTADFIDWYNSDLIDHGRNMLDYAEEAFDSSLSRNVLGIKVPGIHWQMDGTKPHVVAPRAAETTVGVINSDHSIANGRGYMPIMDMVSEYDNVVLHFTCIEMNDKYGDWDSENTSLAKQLTEWFGQAAFSKGIVVKGENALNRDNDMAYAWENIDYHMSTEYYKGITFLRMEDAVYGPSYNFYKDIIAKYTNNAQSDLPSSAKVVTVYYKPIVVANSYYLHSWNNGLNGSMEMVEDADGWWKIDLVGPTDFGFEFGFKDGDAWNGPNRFYAGEADVVYFLSGDGTVYTEKP